MAGLSGLLKSRWWRGRGDFTSPQMQSCKYQDGGIKPPLRLFQQPIRRILELIKAQFTRTGNRPRPVRTEALLRIKQPLETRGIAEDAAARNSKGARVSLTQERLLWRATSIKSNFTKLNGVGLAQLPPAKGLLNLVDILCQDASQRDQA